MRLIESGMNKTSVTAVLIGEATANRRWVNYEIVKSFHKGNGILGIHINRIRGKHQCITARGQNPVERLAFQVSKDGRKILFYELIDRRWITYADLPEINNKKSNTIYFEDSFWRGNDFGKSFRLADIFNTLCWTRDNGHQNFAYWVKKAAEQAGR